MGKSASESGIECTLDGFGFGQPFDTAYHDCCRREDQIRRESGDPEPQAETRNNANSPMIDVRWSILCQHKCIDHDEEMKCDCYPGYRLGQDGRQCDDVDECRNPAACPADQQCVNFVAASSASRTKESLSGRGGGAI
ncbi:hypothetical protein HDE_00175 [Halotydeus destructor]|nr:hypothetical protein HDE_00175 [Halotydeus destructor]